MTRAPGDPAKRLFDVAVSAAALIVTFPLQAAIVAVVLASLGRPVLFRQSRPGLHGRPFTMVKFRTMRERRPGETLADDAMRLTRVGAALRSTSLDELPTLWNVLRGEMSMVGPRPLLVEYLDRYTPEQARRHDVRPGMTGLAQVSGRNALGWAARLKLDVTYVDSRSFFGDLRILAATVAAVIHRHGVSAPGAATMPEFLGTDAEKWRL